MADMLDSNKYFPKPEVIIDLYERLAKGESLGIDWKNPGRYLPDDLKENPVKKKEKGSEKKKSKVTLEKPTRNMKNYDFEEFNKFDFTKIHSNISKGTALLDIKIKPAQSQFPTMYSSEKKKKKVSSISFDAVLKDVMKHRVWEKEDATTTKYTATTIQNQTASPTKKLSDSSQSRALDSVQSDLHVAMETEEQTANTQSTISETNELLIKDILQDPLVKSVPLINLAK